MIASLDVTGTMADIAAIKACTISFADGAGDAINGARFDWKLATAIPERRSSPRRSMQSIQCSANPIQNSMLALQFVTA